MFRAYAIHISDLAYYLAGLLTILNKKYRR